MYDESGYESKSLFKIVDKKTGKTLEQGLGFSSAVKKKTNSNYIKYQKRKLGFFPFYLISGVFIIRAGLTVTSFIYMYNIQNLLSK
jgi:hypothetical protein